MNGIDRLSIRDVDGGAILSVKVVPGSSREKIAGVLGGALKITTSAPAEKGKANAAVAKTLAGMLGVSPRDVQLLAGQTNPRKEFLIAGMSAAAVRKKLKGLS